MVAEVVQSGLAFACDDAARGKELPYTGPVHGMAGVAKHLEDARE